MNDFFVVHRGESGPSSLDSRQLEREVSRERRISGGTFDAASVKERRVSGMSVQSGVRQRRVSGDLVEGGRERKVSGKSLLRVDSSNSINLRYSSSFHLTSTFKTLLSGVRDPGKKSFMFFTSELGKGFIISDEEEVWPLMIQIRDALVLYKKGE